MQSNLCRCTGKASSSLILKRLKPSIATSTTILGQDNLNGFVSSCCAHNYDNSVAMIGTPVVKRNFFNTATPLLASYMTPPTWNKALGNAAPSSRHFSSSSKNNKDEDKNKKNNDEVESISQTTKNKLQKRIKGISMNPKGLSHMILPGYVIEKTNKKTSETSLVNVDRALGFFWMMKDLNESNNKPIVTNSTLIPADEAQIFPSLNGCTTLSDEVVDLPNFLIRNNRSKDANAQCTLVTISYKDFGHKLLPSWTEPFKSTFSSSRYEVVHISVVEGFFFRLLKRPITSSQKQGTPSDQWDRTLTYFDENVEELADFRDALRMHNTLTGYVFLLDGLGRVRFVGSGKAAEEDVEKLLEFAKELTPEPKKRLGGGGGSSSSGGGRVGRKIHRN
uniref:Uncharacterized protein n=2 Tax=Ditylum brightwellii TaxID=49249 RepID=A0A7S1ZNM4_9STRA|mmetsp:Transcript_35386/g.52823  ORF Transcript_35386/g.52823 Transcript_35386/m.52823 type:complete len:392 (+) Transcript_35386:108-1283(+)